jgi:RNA polymerase primary sigma factor
MKPLVITHKITDRNTTAFQKYLNDVQNRTVLTPLEETEYAQRSRDGDEVAKKILIECNLRFVISVAKQYANGVALEDLVNEGNMGLIEAVNRYDETKGFKFISYAVHWIRRYIIEYINTTKSIRLPLNKVQDVSKINRLIIKLEQKLEREITLNDLVNDKYDDSKEISELLRIRGLDISSYNRKASDDDSAEMIDTFAGDYDADELVKDSDREIIKENMLKHLTKKQREVIEYLFGLNGKPPMTLEETGEKYGQSRERIRQIKAKAFDIIRENMDK